MCGPFFDLKWDYFRFFAKLFDQNDYLYWKSPSFEIKPNFRLFLGNFDFSILVENMVNNLSF